MLLASGMTECGDGASLRDTKSAGFAVSSGRGLGDGLLVCPCAFAAMVSLSWS